MLSRSLECSGHTSHHLSPIVDVQHLEGRMINTLLAWQEEKDGPLLSLIRELDMVDEDLGKVSPEQLRW